MEEIEKLLNEYNSGTSSHENTFILFKLLISERNAYLRLREKLKKATHELDDACAHHEVDVCYKKQSEVINRIIGD